MSRLPVRCRESGAPSVRAHFLQGVHRRLVLCGDDVPRVSRRCDRAVHSVRRGHPRQGRVGLADIAGLAVIAGLAFIAGIAFIAGLAVIAGLSVWRLLRDVRR